MLQHLVLDQKDITLLLEVLENARLEVDNAVDGNATVQPDEPFTLMEHYDRSREISDRLEMLQGPVLAKEFKIVHAGQEGKPFSARFDTRGDLEFFMDTLFKKHGVHSVTLYSMVFE